MILRELQISQLGPFRECRLEVSPSVTVLTGSNDVGKSAILNAVETLYVAKPLDESAVNFDRTFETPQNWKDDEHVKVSGIYTIATSKSQYIRGTDIQPEDKFTVTYLCAPNRNSRNLSDHRRGGSTVSPTGNLREFPALLRLPPESQIRDDIELKSASELESRLLRSAFGKHFDAENLKSLSEIRFSRELDKASDRLTSQLRRISPPSMDLKIELKPLMARRDRLGVFLSDRFEGYTPINARGSGVRRILAILVAMLGMDLDTQQVMLIIDEPENSLHPDAQHGLRTFLESLAERETVQVIMATHSPAMINTFYPERLRLVSRENRDERAQSLVENSPARENYVTIRSSLGLSPADSLLYAPVTIIVEGESEVAGIPEAVRKLQAEGVQGFDQTAKLMSQCHLLDGMGDNFEFMCRLAKSQGARTIIFVDGDKIRRVRQQDVAGRHPDVPIVHLPDGMEFEQIIPLGDYLRALREVCELTDEYDEAAFNEFLRVSNLPPQLMLSKRIERWLQAASPDTIYRKPRVIRRAIEIAEPTAIRTLELAELLNKIQMALIKPASGMLT